MGQAPTLESIKYSRGALQLLDQLKLPSEFVYIDICSAEDGWQAIKQMNVRGAPAIAIAATLSLAVECVLEAEVWKALPAAEAGKILIERLEYLRTSRPTAVNLSNATTALTKLIQRTVKRVDAGGTTEVLSVYVDAAEALMAKDVQDNLAIGRHGAAAVLGDTAPARQHRQGQPQDGQHGVTMLTVCNTGSLATARYGTALGIIRSLHEQGFLRHAYCCETRPYNQGSRLTAFELVYEQIPATLIVDSAAAALMQTGQVDAVVAGADRVASNGDSANKIGTYNLAVIAKYHGVKFYIAAPFSTLDIDIRSGADIEIEERSTEEVTHDRLGRVAADGIDVWNPVFDVTPAALIDGIITEHGVITREADAPDMDVRKFVAAHTASL